MAAPLALLAFACNGEAAAQPVCPDLALVLAIDGSGSVTDGEYRFQKSAIASAFRDGAIKSALRQAGTVALSAVFWGDGEFPTQRLAWFIVDQGVGSEAFADEVEASERRVYGDTAIGNGLWAALEMLSPPNMCAHRMMINVSGDGRETTVPKRRLGATLYQAKQRAKQMGVTINALAITADDEELASYYEREVVHGSGGFTMEVNDPGDYASAMRKKLLRELSNPFVASSGRTRVKLVR
ncbi:DUF1194 domain-containing protein [Aliirhizobium terrae]|uniref:DUF1194 domain-containing protein n=1 Tax=Terrirhizobium terrae TaxID=2926709 RepID=UPI0025779722|nr:DUF1194 domain-containing protein [Rhizobium sp. CC-CFT758]WJH40635.1 DUF1194 domain-containing protein [Rhizobium sp. CC-CFT758]